ncbi:MAG: hypothetical protein LUH63_10530 [Parabacteroides sp.]|nr:hypothetical protein [Parabacteroides sp.]
MKKLKVLGLAAVAAGMVTLTSCLDGGGNTQSGGAFGYADFNMEAGGIVATDDYGTIIASNAFNTQLTGGEYISFFANIDYDNQTSSKYITATVSDITTYPEYQAKSYLTDTLDLLPNEMTIDQIKVQGLGNSGTTQYLFTANQHIFMSGGHKNIPSDMKVRYDLSYVGGAEPVTIDGKRVYDFYLRAVKNADGDNTKSDRDIVGAYGLKDFLRNAINVEKSAGKSDVNVRFNYINEFSKDSTSWAWKSSDVYSFAIATYSESK